MSSQKGNNASAQPSEVSSFYAGKSLFITGAAGFLGTVLLEILLRCCPDIKRIFILVRAKKGQEPEERKETIFKNEIFSNVREKYPDVLNKVVVVPGDVSRKDLGMSSEDIDRVSQEATIVFHCAAAISFVKPLSFMIQQNVVGTNNILELCRKLKKLDVLVYTSTAYSNCNIKTEIEEKVYKMPFKATEVLKTHSNGVEKELMNMFSKCQPNFPNYYTFAKCVSESLLAETASDLPVVIVRPSIIINYLNEPHPGFIEDGSALVSLCVGVGRGFIRLLPCDPEKKTNQIPVDITANTHILGGYLQHVERLSSPTVYNCVQSDAEAWTWKEFTECLYQMVLKYPLPNSYQRPNLTLCKSDLKFRVFSVTDHYTPAFVIDSLMWMSGQKPRLLKLYRFFDKNMDITMHFRTNEWIWKRDNFESLAEKINDADKELFPTDLKEATLERLAKITREGSFVYQKANNFKQKQIWSRYLFYYMTPLIQLSVLGSVASALYLAVF